MANRETWAEIFRALGESVIEVLKAEFAVLGEDWKEAGKKIGILVALAVISLGMLVTLIHIGLFSSVGALAALLDWQPWQAGFAVCVAGLLLIAIIGGVAYVTIVRKLESPIASAQQRLGDHFTWWQQQFFADEKSLGGGEVDEQEKASP